MIYLAISTSLFSIITLLILKNISESVWQRNGWPAKGRSRDKFLFKGAAKAREYINQLSLLSVNLLMTTSNSGICSPDSAGAFFLFLAFFLCCQLTLQKQQLPIKWRMLPATSENSGCQGLGVLRIYFHSKMCTNFHAFHPIQWLTFAVNPFNTTSPPQLTWETKTVNEIWCFQEVTVIWGNQSKDSIVIKNINTIS